MSKAQLKAEPEDQTAEGVVPDEESGGESGGGFPPETSQFLSWAAIHFIRAPSARVFQWTTVLIAAALAFAVVLASFIQKDISIESAGEIVSDMGVRDAVVPSEGLVTEILKKHGDKVEAGEIIASMATDSATKSEIDEVIKTLSALIVKVEGARTGQEIILDKLELPTARIFDPNLLQSLTGVEQAIRKFNEEKEYIVDGLQKELGPLVNRNRTLEAKLRRMKASSSRDLLGLYIEGAEDELGKLQTQMLSMRNSAQTKLNQSVGDLLRALRVAVGNLENFVKQRQIKAPVTGVIAKLHFGANTHVAANKPLATIIPEGAQFVVLLKIRSKDIGGVRAGQQIHYRVEAFPYQRYGLFTGEVLTFDQVKESSEGGVYDDFAVRGSIQAPQRLPAGLQSKIKFVGGMKVSATVVTDRKPLSQIIVEKLFGG